MTDIPGAHRAALVEATVAEFADAGFEKASLNRIIRAAGMSKSSFYHAVSSKAELFDAVVRMLINEVSGQWSPPPADTFAGPGFWSQVDAVLADLTELTDRSSALRLLGRLFYLPAGGTADARSELLDAVRRWTLDVLREGVASGEVRDDLPVEVLAAAVFGMLRGLDEWALTASAQQATEAASAPHVLLRALLAVT